MPRKRSRVSPRGIVRPFPGSPLYTVRGSALPYWFGNLPLNLRHPSGETVMATARERWIPALATLVAAAFLTAPLPAADADAALRAKVLELNKLTGNGPLEGSIKALSDDADGTKKLIVVAVKLAKDKNKPLNYNAAYVLGRVAQDVKDPESCEVFYRYCAEEALKLESGDKLAQSLGGLIDLYYEQKKFEKAVAVCKEFLEIEGHETVEMLKPAVMERMIQSLARQKKFDKALKLVNNLVELEEEEKGWWALRLKGWVLKRPRRRTRRSRSSRPSWNASTPTPRSRTTRRRSISSATVTSSAVFTSSEGGRQGGRAAQGAAGHEAGQPDVQQRPRLHLGRPRHEPRRGREADPQGHRRGTQGTRSKKKPKLKPEDDKDNAAYLDSLGWVLFKQKKYKEAKKWLEEAVKDKDGQHIEIFDHLGDVHMALGEKTEAIAAWKKGIETVDKRGNDALPASKRELDRKKIVEGKIKDESK